MRRPFALALVALVLLAAVPAPAAADTRAGGSVVVERGETVRGLTAYGGTVVVRGTVEGDLEAYGGAVVVAPAGNVTGKVRAYGGTVRVDGTVEENVLAYGDSLVLGPDAYVRGSVGAVASRVTVAGTVGGDVTVAAGTVVLKPTAELRGDLNYDGRLTDEGATVEGELRRTSDLELLPSPSGPLTVLLSVYLLLADALLGVLVLFFFPRFARAAADTVAEEPLRTFGVGLGAVVVVGLGAALAAVTVIGVPLALAGLVALLVAAWVGSVLGRYAVGDWLLAQADRDNRFAALAVGLVLVALVARVPHVGPVVRAVVLLLGLGTLALGVRATYELVSERGSLGRP